VDQTKGFRHTAQGLAEPHLVVAGVENGASSARFGALTVASVVPGKVVGTVNPICWGPSDAEISRVIRPGLTVAQAQCPGWVQSQLGPEPVI